VEPMDDFNFDTEDDADDFESFDDSFSDSFDDFEDEESAEEGKDNRTFWLVAGILGAILILALVCMVVYAMVILPSRNDSQATEAAAIHTQNASVEMTAEAEAEARAWSNANCEQHASSAAH